MDLHLGSSGDSWKHALARSIRAQSLSDSESAIPYIINDLEENLDRLLIGMRMFLCDELPQCDAEREDLRAGVTEPRARVLKVLWSHPRYRAQCLCLVILLSESALVPQDLRNAATSQQPVVLT